MSGYIYRGANRLDDTSLTDAGRGEVCYGVRGTVAGWHRHRKAKEQPCDKCREAYNAYHRELRAKDPKHKVRTRHYQRAKQAAWRELARRHPAEFSALFQVELARTASEALS